MTERGEMEAAIEAILFVASEPVPRTRLIELFDEDEREQAAAALAAVLERYGGGEARGVMIEDVAGGVRLVTRPEMGVWLRRFFDVTSGSKLSMAALETLAIVAYRQPITGPEIQELRSVNPVGVLKTLLEKRLVRISGRKEVVGKPFLYATTREFLVHFGLNSLRDLPPLEEFEETFALPAAPAAPAAGSSPTASASPASPSTPTTPATPAIDPEVGDGRLLEEEDDAEERFLREAAALDDDQDAVGEEETAAAATEVER
jgi:segregation and condensation protein B